MKQEVNNTKDKMPDISIEEFDALDGKHKFSREYQRQKRKMWREYRKEVYGSRRNYAKIAVAASLLIVTVPVAVNAANDGDIFNRIWGNAGKKNIEAHDKVIYEEEKGTSYVVTYPKREYVTIAPDEAEELIGGNISKKVMEEQLGDTKLTILSAVSDGQSAVVEFTLEREGGVNALEYDQETNESKGAAFSDDGTFYFYFDDYSDCIYVDLEQSTDDKLYCYDYMIYTPNNNTPPKELQLKLTTYPYARKKAEGKGGYKYQNDVKEKTISIPLKETVEMTDFVNAGGGIVSISPLSMKIDMATGLGLSLKESYPDLNLNKVDLNDLYDASQDPGSIYYVAITDTKGKTYIVKDSETEDHACDVPIDNSTYGCGNEYHHLTYTFNRLVDTNEIASITVNDTEYTRK